MDFLPVTFTTLQYCGVWPSTYCLGWKKITYSIYTSVIAISIFSFGLSGLIQLCLVTRSVDEFIRNSYMLLTTFAVSVKVAMIIIKRDDIKGIFDMLRSELCIAKSEEEKGIQNELDERSSFHLQGYRLLGMGAVLLVTVASIKNNIPTKTLPFSGWFPYNHADSFGYWIAFLHQSIAHGWGALIAVSVDSVIYGTMILTCTQLKILKCRLQKLPAAVKHLSRQSMNCIDDDHRIAGEKEWEESVLACCIQHHMHILQFAAVSNYIYAFVIFLQFLVSGFVICMSVLMLSKMKFMSPEFIFIIFYFFGVLVEIFNFCWFGNEVILESADISIAIYNMNWLGLSLNTQKKLLIIMRRSMYPIKFTSGQMIILSIDSFNALMKLSYSVYNVLSQSG